MASCLISSISEELNCSICLELLTNSMSIACGHNFCEDCILKHIQLSGGYSFPCPECRTVSVLKDLWPNQQLCKVVQSFKLLQTPLRRSLNQRKLMKTKFYEEITLDPKTAHPGIILSTDRKTMRGNNAWKKLHCDVEECDRCCLVLATQSFKSGRHYWEVTVGNSSAWYIGLCENSVKRKGRVIPCSSTGYWLLRLIESCYLACTIPRTKVPITGKLYKVGIFLDYEMGDIVFYDVDRRCHIYTFTSSFLEPLIPIFCIGLNSKNENILSIDPVLDEAKETLEDTSFRKEPSL
ncbi:E3 ubiquitin-protein ligase TRIM39-like [Sarcophilus harrisii]|uniref:E3 ubiquitin-protein ligase TRIM39-like n=1 Tax=Sarcophilus harrisii TaxID=9305 RepID=UPI001301AAF2|nr:E3 ubiquitin-protein ligase TRIM39-like [Sarcophilus harrisii]